MKIIIRLLFLISIASNTLAAIENIDFSNKAEEDRYYEMANELRCLVCQNQSLADSDAELARDLRMEILKLMRSGKTNQEIMQFMQDRYGNFVLYRPPVEQNTWMLWFGPFLFLLTGFVGMLLYIKKQSRDNGDNA